MSWFRWLFRGGERDRAYQRLQALRESYGQHGDRVIKLSARTDLLRKSQGATQRSFEFVEKTFVEATTEYSRLQVVLENLEAGLEKGVVGDFTAAETQMQGLQPKLDELDRHLSKWESRWTQAPQEIEAAERSLAGLKAQFAQAQEALGGSLPLQQNLVAMEKHLARARQVLAEGNPIEAGQLVDDFEIALKKVATEVGLYTSGLSAVEQVEQSLARIRTTMAPAGSPAPASQVVAALAAAEALIPRLRPALAAGNFGPFQQDLLAIQEHLAKVR